MAARRHTDHDLHRDFFLPWNDISLVTGLNLGRLEYIYIYIYWTDAIAAQWKLIAVARGQCAARVSEEHGGTLLSDERMAESCSSSLYFPTERSRYSTAILSDIGNIGG